MFYLVFDVKQRERHVNGMELANAHLIAVIGVLGFNHAPCGMTKFR